MRSMPLTRAAKHMENQPSTTPDLSLLDCEPEDFDKDAFLRSLLSQTAAQSEAGTTSSSGRKSSVTPVAVPVDGPNFNSFIDMQKRTHQDIKDNIQVLEEMSEMVERMQADLRREPPPA